MSTEEFKSGELIEVKYVGYITWAPGRYTCVGRRACGWYVVEGPGNNIMGHIIEVRRPVQTVEEFTREWYVVRNGDMLNNITRDRICELEDYRKALKEWEKNQKMHSYVFTILCGWVRGLFAQKESRNFFGVGVCFFRNFPVESFETN